ncbi:MAG TPA: hypothetical protein VK249_34745 [Anaerolineales bacterium]|nr:hypothetical protein [Anaerolineales bacterium]
MVEDKELECREHSRDQYQKLASTTCTRTPAKCAGVTLAPHVICSPALDLLGKSSSAHLPSHSATLRGRFAVAGGARECGKTCRCDGGTAASQRAGFQAVSVARSWSRQSGVVSSHPPAPFVTLQGLAPEGGVRDGYPLKGTMSHKVSHLV